MKKSINTWSMDCKAIGISARRSGYANLCLSEEEAEKAYLAYENATHEFANKYSMTQDNAKAIAVIMSDNIDLGLAY